MFSKRKKEKIYPIIFILTVICAVVYKIFLSGRLEAMKSDEIVIETTESTVIEVSSNIYVYVCGEVNCPGVYEIERGSILNDAVELAGGLTDNAAAEDIDLVMVLNENISVKIPSYDDIDTSVITIGSDPEEDKSGLININTADKQTLMTLPGIGESTADAIIDYRSSHVFEKEEDLMNVQGIGESKFNKVRSMICVD